MSGTISNDYVSMINKTGSGYNIPVIVDAIVDAAITPVKDIVTAQKNKVDAAVTGMAALKSSMLLSQTTINKMSGSSDYNLSSVDTKTVTLSVNDRSKLASFSKDITDVTIAKPMIFTVKSWSSPTQAYQQAFIDITINGSAIPRLDTNGTNATTLTQRLNAITGLKAELIKADTTYTMVVTSDLGSNFTMAATAGSNKMNTETSPLHSLSTKVQSGANATFKLDGATITRSTNTITDLIDGVTINLVANNSATPTKISSSLSSTKIQETVEGLITELNAYKADLNALGFIDPNGDENGDLANSGQIRNAKRRLTNLMSTPISGYGDANIHFVNFGIKTAKDGSYVFDQLTFNRTFKNSPEKFDALTQDKAYASDPNVFVYSTPNSALPQGKYSFRQSDINLLFESNSLTTLTRSGPVSGTYTFQDSSKYAGFLFSTNDASPADFDLYIGRSAKTKLFNFFNGGLGSSGIHNKTVALYKGQSDTLSARLDKIDLREARLQQIYTKQFSEMEKVVNASTSSQEYVTQLVDGWNKS
tara:strand:- start:8719 stop:10320 length:1602 start_codon:yes stop_codon:yes gene_type:complete